MEKRVEAIEQNLRSLITILVNISTKLEETNQKIDANFDLLKNLDSKSEKGFKVVNSNLEDVKSELQKIQTVSNYTEEFENLLRKV